MNGRIKLGDLVAEAPFGRDWLQNNPWMLGESIGLVVEIIDQETVIVFWSQACPGTFQQYGVEYLEVINESR